MTPIFTGSATALVTPFTEEGVCFEALGQLIDQQLAGGTDALVVAGTTGEPSTMTAQEKAAVIEFTVQHVAGRVPVIAGTGSNSTAAAVAASSQARELGEMCIRDRRCTGYELEGVAKENGGIIHLIDVYKRQPLAAG